MVVLTLLTFDYGSAGLSAKARFAGPEHQVHIRLAEHNGSIYLDLANRSWQVIEITKTGWRVLDQSPVRFRRTPGMLALPTPVKGGNLDDLRQFLNVPGSDEWILLQAWMVGSLRANGTYPVFVLHGEQGSAKSTTERMIRASIDPNTVPLRPAPPSDRDLMIAAHNSWIIALDNLSVIRDWLSDALCRLATGCGYSTRKLYTDTEEILIDVQRPVIVNGIEKLTARGDLVDLSIILYLPSISMNDRLPEKNLWARLEEEMPGIVGGLLTAASAALADISKVNSEELPRMADFTLKPALYLASLGNGEVAPDTDRVRTE